MVDERIIKALETRFWMTREELCDELNVSDRNLRDKIADINVAGGPYENVFVIGTSDMPGYRLARTAEDLKRYIRERTKRAEMIMLPVEKAERILKEMEKWTS